MYRFLPAAAATTTPLVLLLLLLLVDTTRADCPPAGCGPFGECHTDTRSCGDSCETTCRCMPGYTGSDCSLQVNVCPESVIPSGNGAAAAAAVRACFNGGICAVREKYNADTGNAYQEWYCDCREASGEAAVYAGHQCEFPSTTSCLTRGRESDYAFCVNDGGCLKHIEPGEDHPGCFCVGDFEGRHCQYARGTAPVDELIYEAKLEQESESGMSGFAIFLTVMAALVFVGGVAYFVYDKQFKGGQQQQQQKESNDAIDASNIPNDLVLDETTPTDVVEDDTAAKEII